MQAREVAEEAASKIGLSLRLMFEVHEEERALALETGFDHDVGLAPSVHDRVTEQFFVEEFEAGWVGLFSAGKGILEGCSGCWLLVIGCWYGPVDALTSDT